MWGILLHESRVYILTVMVIRLRDDVSPEHPELVLDTTLKHSGLESVTPNRGMGRLEGSSWSFRNCPIHIAQERLSIDYTS